MRVFLGIVLGVFLTIGFAYVYDASTSGTSEPAAQTKVEQRPMVNWDVVGNKWNRLTDRARAEWVRLAG